eukprot:Rmarinus@m.29130
MEISLLAVGLELPVTTSPPTVSSSLFGARATHASDPYGWTRLEVGGRVANCWMPQPRRRLPALSRFNATPGILQHALARACFTVSDAMAKAGMVPFLSFFLFPRSTTCFEPYSLILIPDHECTY